MCNFFRGLFLEGVIYNRVFEKCDVKMCTAFVLLQKIRQPFRAIWIPHSYTVFLELKGTLHFKMTDSNVCFQRQAGDYLPNELFPFQEFMCNDLQQTIQFVR